MLCRKWSYPDPWTFLQFISHKKGYVLRCCPVSRVVCTWQIMKRLPSYTREGGGRLRWHSSPTQLHTVPCKARSLPQVKRHRGTYLEAVAAIPSLRYTLRAGSLAYETQRLDALLAIGNICNSLFGKSKVVYHHLSCKEIHETVRLNLSTLGESLSGDKLLCRSFGKPTSWCDTQRVKPCKVKALDGLTLHGRHGEIGP